MSCKYINKCEKNKKRNYKSIILFYYSTFKNSYEYWIKEFDKLLNKFNKLKDTRIGRELKIVINELYGGRQNVMSGLKSIYDLLDSYDCICSEEKNEKKKD